MLPEDPEEPPPGEGIEEPPLEPPDAPPDGILEPPPPDCPPEEGMLEELPELPPELPEEPPEPPGLPPEGDGVDGLGMEGEEEDCCSGQPPIRNAAATPMATSLLAGSSRLRKSVCIVKIGRAHV